MTIIIRPTAQLSPREPLVAPRVYTMPLVRELPAARVDAGQDDAW